jgi:hypothetical protein
MLANNSVSLRRLSHYCRLVRNDYVLLNPDGILRFSSETSTQKQKMFGIDLQEQANDDNTSYRRLAIGSLNVDATLI